MEALSNVHWLVPPAVGAVAYKLSIRALQKVFPTTPKWINQFALVHNIILAVYSCVTFLAVGAQLLQYTDEVYTNKFFARVEFWSYLFYLSKYYEFIDTYILIMKQKPPSFLQTYHHTGAVLTMAAVYHTKASAIWVFVLFNSFIHTLMYTYYAMSILKIPAPFKRYLTMMQIVQFATGLMATAPYIYFTEEFNWESRVSVGVTQFYAFTLILLFVSFFKSTYSADKKKRESADTEMESNPSTPSSSSQAVKRTSATNTRSKAG